jgi:O-antigen/teichoic acid export membrane protein
MSRVSLPPRPRHFWESARMSLTSHLGVAMYREGYALVLSSGIGSLLGLLYWVVAARSYAAVIVGLNSAVISAMMFVAGISQLNLANAAVRFLPTAGVASTRFVTAIYLVTFGSCLVASTIFLAGAGIWTPTLRFLQDVPGPAIAFTISAMAWGAFNLQHSILAGLRRAVWVPIENGVYSVGKLALLALFALILPQWGIFASWTSALAMTILPTAALIYGRLIPRHREVTGVGVAAPRLSTVARYLSGDYFGGLCWLASTSLVPIIVFQQAGAAANAYYSLSWVMVLPLYAIGASIGWSFVASAVFETGILRTHGYRMLLQTSLLVVPMTIALIIGAPYILRIFGGDYAEQGTSVLRLLALAALPGTINTMYANVARVQRRMARVAMVFGGQSVIVLGLTWLLLKPYGLPAVGVAWLVGQSAVAIVVATHTLVALRPQLPHRSK